MHKKKCVKVVTEAGKKITKELLKEALSHNVMNESDYRVLSDAVDQLPVVPA